MFVDGRCVISTGYHAGTVHRSLELTVPRVAVHPIESTGALKVQSLREGSMHS